MLKAYYRFQLLPDEVRTNCNIRSKARLDCVASYGDYQGLTNFVNSKGQLFFYKTPSKDIVQTDSKRLAEWSLTNNSQNLSSIYIEDLDCPEIGYGYPNPNRLCSGNPNPMFPFRLDGFLFVVNKDYSQIELFVIHEGRNLIHSHYQKFIDGGYDEEAKRLRERATVFYKYEGLVL